MKPVAPVQDENFMRMALDLAWQGRGWVGPNPMVGAVVVRDGEIVGRGYHLEVGKPHAEVLALEDAGERARGATLYVTLEPCNHFGRTPPCTTRVIEAGIARVVYASRDANPRTAGQARPVLEAAGLAVEEGLLADAAAELNAPFFKYISTGQPFVVCKIAMSLDGKIATATGHSRWISGPEARDLVQQWRATYGAVMVGAGTIVADDPQLTCRLAGAHSPWRIVVDPQARTSPAARWIGDDGRAIVAVSESAPPARVASLQASGATALVCPEFSDGGARTLDLRALLADLARREIPSVLIEGGGGLNATVIRQGIVDRLRFFVSPMLVGGRSAPTPMDGLDIQDLSEAIGARFLRVERVGRDLLIEADVPDPTRAQDLATEGVEPAVFPPRTSFC